MTRRLCFLWTVGAAVALGPPGRADPADGSQRPAPAAEPDAWFLLPFDAPDGVGRQDGQEADSFGPVSFAVAPDGTLLVLDAVRLRVLLLAPDGGRLGEIPLPSHTFEDLAVLADGAIALLDRSVGQALLVLDAWGRALTAVDLVGRGVSHPGAVTALLPRPDGLWLEVRHRYSVRVLDAAGRPCRRQIRRGRPGRDGRALHAALTDAGTVRLWRSDGVDPRPRFPVEIATALPAYRVVWLDQQPSGTVWLALHGVRFDPARPARPRAEHTVFVSLDSSLRPQSRFSSPYTLGRRYQRGEVRLDPAGGLWQMAVTEQGALLLHFPGRAP